MNSNDNNDNNNNNLFANLHTSPSIYNGFIIPVRFNACGKTFRALVDTGADYTLMSSLVVGELRKCKSSSSSGKKRSGGQSQTTTEALHIQRQWPSRLKNFGIRDASGNKLGVQGYANDVTLYVPGMNKSGGIQLPPGVPVIKGLSPEIILGHDTLALMQARVKYGDTRDATTIRICDDARLCRTFNMGSVRRNLMAAQRNATVIEDSNDKGVV